ncbi:unnamed protein product [Paramecium pentaurelia]|uniref:Uncharacterized protein n=1 Tax=Paramecium pentaurelia TaxID=43138 RepID=A0A8S1WSD8_9CILI|nr:unnamed protein product [Paramecium pentaurelia]
MRDYQTILKHVQQQEDLEQEEELYIFQYQQHLYGA